MDHNIESLDWSSNNPDLNPMENLFAIVNRGVKKKTLKTIAQLKRVVQQECNNIPKETLQTLIRSMSKRIKAVIQVKGGPMKY